MVIACALFSLPIVFSNQVFTHSLEKSRSLVVIHVVVVQGGIKYIRSLGLSRSCQKANICSSSKYNRRLPECTEMKIDLDPSIAPHKPSIQTSQPFSPFDGSGGCTTCF